MINSICLVFINITIIKKLFSMPLDYFFFLYIYCMLTTLYTRRKDLSIKIYSKHQSVETNEISIFNLNR